MSCKCVVKYFNKIYTIKDHYYVPGIDSSLVNVNDSIHDQRSACYCPLLVPNPNFRFYTATVFPLLPWDTLYIYEDGQKDP
mmetsp:Transcript_1186/g.1361  ORF Transcript_1186/g.1361 Transcript_1186/m.1361 type:complete len:81 (-) Transcript_1186:115-357(-)